MDTVNINGLDVAAAIILGIFVIRGYCKGLIKSVFGVCALFIGLFVSQWLYPIVSGFLKSYTGLPGIIQSFLTEHLGLKEALVEQTVAAQATFIEGLHLPAALSQLLLVNNNSELYRLLQVDKVQDFVSAYLTGLIINGIAMLLVFLATLAVLAMISASLDLLAKLPVISTFNKAGGVACGLLTGTVVIWLLFVAATLLFMQPTLSTLMTQLETSRLAVVFYEHNLLLNMITKAGTGV